MNDVLLLWLFCLMPINFDLFTAVTAKQISNDLAFVSFSANSSSSPSATFSSASSPLPSSKILKKKVRILPFLKNKTKAITSLLMNEIANLTSFASFSLLCNQTFLRKKKSVNETNDGMFNSTPQNNYLQLVPKQLTRKRRNTSPSAYRQKRMGFPPPAMAAPPAFFPPAFPASAHGSYPIESMGQEFYNGPKQIEQQQPQVAEQMFQQVAESSAFQSPPSAFFAQPPPPAAPQPPAPFIEPPPPAPIYQPPVEPIGPIGQLKPVGFTPVEPSFFQAPLAVQPLPYQEETISPTSVPFIPTSTSAADRCELLRYPLPECYTDDSNLMCCNSELENTMKTAFDELTNAEDNFHRCNVQQIANKVQFMSEDRFNTSFEVITGIGDYASRSHFFHNLICKIERDQRFILAYATPRPEYDSVPIDGDTSGQTHGASGLNAPGAYRNSESVQHGKTRQTGDKSDLLNFVYTFRRTQRAQNKAKMTYEVQ